MANLNKFTNEQLEQRFTELIPAFTRNSAIAEANRCLYCYDSPCTKACPTHIDIPTFIKKIATENTLGATKTILEKNWIALTCAKACPVGDLCEGACVFNDKGEEPIQIGRLQRFAIDQYFESGSPLLFSKQPKINKSVGIIGSGPAGLACGAELALLGIDSQIYESNEIPGGLDTWGIAPYKTRQADSLKEVDLVKSYDVNIMTGVTVGDSISIDELLQNHEALFIGIGLGEGGSLKIPGENLESVVEAIKFIEELKAEDWSSVKVGEHVSVIGAGNTAIDAATEAKRLGAKDVRIIYRRSEKEMPASDFEYELAKNDGIVFNFLTSPTEFIGDSKVRGIKCVKMKLGDKDKKGKGRPIPIPDSEFIIKTDMVILALGQQPKFGFLESIPDLKIEENRIEVNPETFQTGNPKIFAGGDCINGGKEVVNAAYDGKNAAHGIKNFLINDS